MRLLSFGNYDFTAAGVKPLEFGPGLQQFATQLISVAGANGAFDAYGLVASPRLPGQLTLSLALWTAGGVTKDARLDTFLAETAKGVQSLRVEQDDASIRRAYAKCVRVEVPRNRNTYSVLNVAVVFDVAEPYWYGDDQTTSTYAIGSGAVTIDFTNLGTAPLTKAIIRYTGSATGAARLQNNTNGYYIAHTGALSAGSIWEINLGAQTVTLGGVDDYANVYANFPDDQIGMFKFDVGLNELVFSTPSGTASGTLELIYRWMYH